MKLLILFSIVVSAYCQSCPSEGYLNFPDREYCDRYVQCKNGEAIEVQCNDGLVYNELLETHAYPCSYPTEVDCSSRDKIQPAQPTEYCGRQWGYFGSGDRSVCDIFYNCVDGTAYRFDCPPGLAFSSVTYRCEWPEDSPDCDVREYLGFECPAGRDLEQEALVGVPRYASQRDCKTFFTCTNGAPRLHHCEIGTVFNDDIHNCDEPENVRQCQGYYPPQELADIRERKERRRLAAERRRQEFLERFNKLNE